MYSPYLTSFSPDPCGIKPTLYRQIHPYLRVISKTGQHYAFHLFRRATIPLPIRAKLHPHRPSLADCFFSLRLSDGPLS